MAANDELTPYLDLIGSNKLGVLVTLKRDGRPQLSNVIYDYDPAERVIRASITDTRAKTRNLRRDPRASFYVNSSDGWSYAVAEGTAELTPVTTKPDDATAEELVDLYRSISGEHPDWTEYREAMVAERRLVVRLGVERAYGLVR